ncbi:MAG: molybdopterin dinucleotide binding domain-containing protein, partial [Polaromonas sp.]|uniref:molybdopterin dinucleotide binding domain-containing protein n=1 Tax=Polaromonas sp. TaxID=1869339 RepID=UPI0027344E8B
ALVHPLDLADLGGKPGDVVTIASRRGEVTLYARADESSPRGAVFVPFCYYEAAINKLTNAALDPFAKIPEFKYCAIRVTLGGTPPQQASYGGGQALRRVMETTGTDLAFRRGLSYRRGGDPFHPIQKQSR